MPGDGQWWQKAPFQSIFSSKSILCEFCGVLFDGLSWILQTCFHYYLKILVQLNWITYILNSRVFTAPQQQFLCLLCCPNPRIFGDWSGTSQLVLCCNLWLSNTHYHTHNNHVSMTSKIMLLLLSQLWFCAYFNPRFPFAEVACYKYSYYHHNMPEYYPCAANIEHCEKYLVQRFAICCLSLFCC